jgi:DNA mismatch repair protein MutS2
VQLFAMKHPLMVLSGMEVIPNDLELTPDQVLIITGPNAGGKTVCLKTLGLCTLMLRAGMHLPAGPDSQLPLFDTVATEMGDDQSIEQNLSTFTAHLSHLMEFLDRARRGALILLDEIAIGTDPGEGAALAQSLLEAFAETGAQVVVTTHYERLKSLPLAEPKLFANASVGFDLEQMQPTYRLHLGTPGSSGALAVARRLGLREHLVERAAGLMDQGSQEFSQLITALSGERTALEQERAALAEAEAEARRAAERHRAESERLRQKQQEAVRAEYNQAIEELKMARSALERVRSLLRRPTTKERVKQADRQISKAAEKILKHEQDRATIEGRVPQESELVPGTRVLVQRLGGEGTVIEPPSRGKVLVRVGAIRTKVAIKDTLLSRDARAVSEKRSAPPRSDGPKERAKGGEEVRSRPVLVRTDANSLDIRGKRVDEALSELDKFLDDALRAEEPVLMIIHGHGTGALRAAVREHLQEQGFVERFEPAPPQEGGDGVTVVWLK